MKIKIKDEWFDTGDQTPMMLVLTETDNENISNIPKNCSRIAYLPDTWESERIDEYMEINMRDRKKEEFFKRTQELEKYNRRISEMQTLSTNWDFISKDLQKDVDSAIGYKIKELKDEMYDKFKDLTAPLDEKL
jgi:hypothetical protein